MFILCVHTVVAVVQPQSAVSETYFLGTLNAASLQICLCLSESLTLHVSPSLTSRRCGSVPADSSSALFRCHVLSRGGISGDRSRVHITTLPHIRQESLVCTHTKVLVIFIVCCCFFTSDVQCLPHLIPFHSVAWLCCALPSFPSASNSTS